MSSELEDLLKQAWKAGAANAHDAGVEGVFERWYKENVVDLRGQPLMTATLWLNAFRCVRPAEEFTLDIGKSILASIQIPGTTWVRISAT